MCSALVQPNASLRACIDEGGLRAADWSVRLAEVTRCAVLRDRTVSPEPALCWAQCLGAVDGATFQAPGQLGDGPITCISIPK